MVCQYIIYWDASQVVWNIIATNCTLKEMGFIMQYLLLKIGSILPASVSESERSIMIAFVYVIFYLIVIAAIPLALILILKLIGYLLESVWDGCQKYQQPSSGVTTPYVDRSRNYSTYSRQEIRDMIEQNKYEIANYPRDYEGSYDSGMDDLRSEQKELYDALVAYRPSE